VHGEFSTFSTFRSSNCTTVLAINDSNNCNSNADRAPSLPRRNTSSDRHGTAADPFSFPSLGLTALSADAGNSNGYNTPASKHEVVMPHGLDDVKYAFTLPFLDLPFVKDSAATAVAPSDRRDAAQHRTLSPFPQHPHTDARSLRTLYMQDPWTHKSPARPRQYTHGMASLHSCLLGITWEPLFTCTLAPHRLTVATRFIQVRVDAPWSRQDPR